MFRYICVIKININDGTLQKIKINGLIQEISRNNWYNKWCRRS